jgi:hypothetical protein
MGGVSYGIGQGRVKYPAHNPFTPSTFCNHIPGAISHFAHHIHPALLHEIPIRRSGSVSQCVIMIRLDVFVAAVQRLHNKLGAELQQVLADLMAGARQIIEGIEINQRCYHGHGAARTCLSTQGTNEGKCARCSRIARKNFGD